MSIPPAGPPTAGPPADPATPHTSEQPVCPRHPDRVSYVRCQRCSRPTCPECQRPAAVGIQCVDCVREGARTVPTPRTRFGAAVRSGPPVVTWTLIGACVAVFLMQQVRPATTSELAFVGIFAGAEPWRFITSAFVHSPSSILHILFNMYLLYAFGPSLEAVLGRARYLLAYLLCAVGGSLGVLLLTPVDPGWFTQVVGASGAIFGFLLIHIVLQLGRGSVPTSLLVLLGLNLAMPLVVSGIAWQAHLGGAAVGALIGGILLLTSAPGRSPEAARRRAWSWPALGLVAVVLVALSVWRLYDVLGPAAFRVVGG